MTIRAKYQILCIPLTLFMLGCATAGKINRIHVGMPKDEVIDLMGKPTSTSATHDVEYLNYALSETEDDAFVGRTSPYFVRIIDGKVNAYGRHGDFDSTKDNTHVLKIQTDEKSDSKTNLNISESNTTENKLIKLKNLFEKGLISKEEYEIQKKQILDEFVKQ